MKNLEYNSPDIYTLENILRTKIVAVHQLPKNEETLWLRILGSSCLGKLFDICAGLER